jgi:hypothetical protein
MRGNAILEHRIRYAKRYPLGTLYPDVAKDVVETYLKNPDLSYEQYFPSYGNYRERPKLVIDATGVGAAVRDEFLKAGIELPSLKAVVITGGVDEDLENGRYYVPKSRLLERLQIDAQFEQLKISGGLETLDTLKRELANIRPKIRGRTPRTSPTRRYVRPSTMTWYWQLASPTGALTSSSFNCST